MKGFSSEAHLAREGRRLLRTALAELACTVRTRYEVPAPGSVPDLVMFSKEPRGLRYVVTVEFKLRRWRRALAQAFRHRNFGNEAYVVMDEAHSRSALENVHIFRSCNVGLVTVNIQEQLRVWHYPVPQVPFSEPFARAMAQSLLAPGRNLRSKTPFIHSARGGVALAALRERWPPSNPYDHCEE